MRFFLHVQFVILALIFVTGSSDPLNAIFAQTDDFVEYVVEGGNYSVRLPATATIYQNERPSVDGVSVSISDTLTVQTATYVLAIRHYNVWNGTPLHKFVQDHTQCIEIDKGGELIRLNRMSFLFYTDTNCGPLGSSFFFQVVGNKGYRVAVESAAPYVEIEDEIEAILSTIHFLPPGIPFDQVVSQDQDSQIDRIIVRATPTPHIAPSRATCYLPEPVQIALRENPDATLSEMVEAVNIRWMLLSSIHQVDIVPAQRLSALDMSLLLVKWRSPQPGTTSLSFLWQKQEEWHEQTLCIENQNLLDAQLGLPHDGVGVEVTAIVDTCVGATSECQQALVYQLQSGQWQETWRSTDVVNWPRSHTSIRLPDEQPGTIWTRSSSWHLSAPSPAEIKKRNIFRESNAGPHRWFNDIWQRQAGGYVHVARFTEQSAYNTLVEFLYALKNGEDTTYWITSPWILDQSALLNLAQLPENTVPQLSKGDNGILHGPITIETGDRTIVFRFVERRGRFVIGNIDEITESTFVTPYPTATVRTTPSSR